MDNLCHTLVGAAMGRAGLASRTRLAGATLMVAANLPDLDVLVFATDVPSIAFRRGWTHGVLAQLVLPVGLAAVMALVGRARPSRPGEPPLSAAWLLALSYLGLYSHVFLDFLNTYGIRLLAPLEWRWFYGDAVFILDPWLWLALGAGIWISRRRLSPVPARAALALAVVYIGVMLATGRAAHDAVLDAWRAQRGGEPRSVMVGPVPVSPFTREVIVDAGDHYETGTFAWGGAGVAFDGERVPKNDRAAEVAAARRTPPIAAFLVWSRFPFYQLETDPAGVRVTVGDMRFANGALVRRAQFVQSVVVPRAVE
jgi:inner membrane protein